MSKRIGLLGGTFDPIHIGHLCIAESVMYELDLESVYFIPAGQPPHKTDRNVTPKAHRLEMVKRAIADDHRFQVCTWEIEREQPSLTIETLQALSPTFEENPYFIIGLDSLLTLHTWDCYQQFGNYCDLVVVPRSTQEFFQESDIQRWVNQHLPELAGHVFWVDMPMIDISSTQLRSWLISGRPSRYFLLPGVWEYIQENRIYHR